MLAPVTGVQSSTGDSPVSLSPDELSTAVGAAPTGACQLILRSGADDHWP